MGKTGKLRKKRKSLLVLDTAADEGDIDSERLTLSYLTRMAEDPLCMVSGKYKRVRAALFPLFSVFEEHQRLNSLGKYAGRISEALLANRWDSALALLQAMQANQEACDPKLGSIQRWTREACFIPCPQTKIEMLDAILRACGQGEADTPTCTELKGRVLFRDSLVVSSCHLSSEAEGHPSEEDFPFHEVSTEKRWKGSRDLVIFGFHPPDEERALQFDPSPHVSKVPLPWVNGAFVLTNVLTRRECLRLIDISTAMGYAPDAEYQASQDPSDSGGSAAFGCVWLVGKHILDQVYSRCRDFLPPKLQGDSLAGINARWRFYRYQKGAVYRPHIDGAWPGSGLSPEDSSYQFDAFGDRRSRLTFLFYLNDDFEGGNTTFFRPSSSSVGALDSYGVVPKSGCVLVFPHGDTSDALLHEGSEVTRGAKYVIRTDVLYTHGARLENAPSSVFQ